MAGRSQGKENSRRLLITGIGVIFLLLLLLLMVGLVRKKQEKAEAESQSILQSSLAESRSVEASIEASIAEAEAAKPKLSLTESTNPEIIALAESYFGCRLSADARGLYDLYGKEEDQAFADLSVELTAQQSWVRSYDDVKVYVLPGMQDGEIIGVVTYRVNFRRVNTKAPGIMYFYAVNEGGNWRLCENLLKEVRDYIDTAFSEAGVQTMIDENTIALREALDSDSDLALIYKSFMNGEIYSDYNLDPDREQTVDLFLNPEDSILITQE